MKHINSKLNLKIIIIIAMLIITSIIFIMILPNLYKEDKISIQEIKNIEKDKENAIIYVYTGNKKICLECREHIDYLNKKRINYKLYDKSKIEEEEYKEFLKTLHIDLNTFSPPALLYIKDGKIASYIMNIKNKKSIEKFINDYNLTTIK